MDEKKKLRNEAEMEEIEKMLFKKSVEVGSQLKEVIKSMSDIYKEFRKNGLNQSEAMTMVTLLLTNMKGESK